tara:strand:- start:116 stop:1177 length:1062 start_codon:yes stop_codon:yes gene_type:complete
MHFLNKLYILFIILALNIFFFSTVKAQAKSFDINNIEVSKPFENNFNKNLVIDIGFDKAFSELLNILIKSSDVKKLKNIRLNEIKSMVDSFSIKEEKFIDQTYYVNLGVSFNKKKIFDYLEKKNIFPSQIIKKKFLFIPIIIDENINSLNIFSDNLVYENWNKFNKQYHLINYLIPTEDLEDLAEIKKNYDSIEKYDFKEIIKKYFLDNSIIALIFKNGDEVRILSKIITKDEIVIKNNSYKKFNLDDQDKIEFLINDLKSTYEDVWKDYNQINTSIKLPLFVRVKNDNSAKLSNFEKILNEIDLVNDFSITKFDKNYSFFQIIFNGTSVNFINTMKDKNYLFDTQKKIWILK